MLQTNDEAAAILGDRRTGSWDRALEGHDGNAGAHRKRTICAYCVESALDGQQRSYDLFVLEMRASARIRDPRRGTRGRVPRSPLLRGHTDEGEYFYVDETGELRHGKPTVNDLGDSPRSALPYAERRLGRRGRQ